MNTPLLPVSAPELTAEIEKLQRLIRQHRRISEEAESDLRQERRKVSSAKSQLARLKGVLQKVNNLQVRGTSEELLFAWYEVDQAVGGLIRTLT